MKAYPIAEIEVPGAGAYAEHIAAAEPLVLRHGGRYLVRGGKTLPVAGGWNPQRMLAIEFDSLTRLQACFAGEEYPRIAPLRLASARSHPA